MLGEVNTMGTGYDSLCISANAEDLNAMRPLEVLLVVLVVFSALALFSRKATRTLLIWLGALDFIALLAHAILKGPHWQMAPAYVGVMLFTAVCGARGQTHRRVITGGMILLVAGACALSAFLPMFRLPEPTGPYPIGTQILHLVNDHPLDPSSSAGPDGKRELMIQVWYPAALSNAPRAPYRKLLETTPLSSYQAVLPTHARWNAPFALSNGAFPLLLLNPAWNGRRTYYMYLVEDLVSQGYVVVGIDHTGNSGPTAFPDGHVLQPLKDPRLDFSIRSYAELNAFGAQQLEIQVDDDRFVLDQLQQLNQAPSNWLYRRLDMDRVGALGHSFGGAVSAEVCLEDPRFKSALDMDGSFWGPVQQAGLAKPLMMIEEEYGQYTPAELQLNHTLLMNHLFDLSDMAMMQKSNGYQIVLHGSTHSSFTDRSLFSPVRQYSEGGTIPANREYMMIRQYTLAFFNKTLRGENSTLLDGADRPYPEASLMVLRRP
jgi:predicted dienelactone hydrolase